jgi:type VI secretion system protein VasJ
MPDYPEMIEKCLAPLEGESPVGEDIKHDFVFGEIKNEVGKLTGDIDWEKVVEDSAALLSTKSKDLNVAGFLTLGLFRRDGFGGLNAGLKIYKGILSQFEDSFFPKGKKESKTLKMRRNSLEWLQDENRLVSYIKTTPPKPSDARDIIESFETITEIRELIEETFKPPVKLSRLLNAIGEYRPQAEKELELQKEKEPKEPAGRPENATESENPANEEVASSEPEAVGGEDGNDIEAKAGEGEESPPPEEEAPQPSATKTVPAPAASSSNAISASDDLPEDAFHAMVKISSGLRAENPAAPVPYRLLRLAKWEKIEAPPPDNTLSLHPREVKPIMNQMGSANPESLLNLCETFFANKGIWWLDLQRAVFESLEKLGPEFRRAADAVREETGRLLRRFPELAAMKYKDGMPFADDMTRGWLEDLVAEESSGGKTDQIDDGIEKELSRAEAIAGEGKLPEALVIIQSQANSAVSRRDAFRCRLKAGQLCLKKGRPTEAGVIFKDLYKTATKIGLAEWEPPLFLDLCIGLEKFFRRDQAETPPENIQEIQESILRINLGYSFGPANTGK